MRLHKNHPKHLALFRSGKTFYRCLVRSLNGEDPPSVVMTLERPVGTLGKRRTGHGYSPLRCGSHYATDTFGHSDSVVCFSSRREALRFMEAVRIGDRSHPFVGSALRASADDSIRFRYTMRLLWKD